MLSKWISWKWCCINETYQWNAKRFASIKKFAAYNFHHILYINMNAYTQTYLSTYRVVGFYSCSIRIISIWILNISFSTSDLFKCVVNIYREKKTHLNGFLFTARLHTQKCQSSMNKYIFHSWKFILSNLA